MLFYLLMVLGLNLIILIHELGHYLVAKQFGIKTEIFAVGLGRTLYSKQLDSTLFRINLIPLGGYVSLKTQLGNDDDDNYLNASWSTKCLILLAGPMVNACVGIALLFLSFQIGVTVFEPVIQQTTLNSPLHQAGIRSNDRITQVNGKQISTLNQLVSQLIIHIGDDQPVVLTTQASTEHSVDLSNIALSGPNKNLMSALGINNPAYTKQISSVIADSPAAEAGLQPGDTIVRINNQPLFTWDEILSVIQASPNQTLTIELTRDEATRVYSVSVADNHSQGFIGITPMINESMFSLEQLNFADSALKSIEESLDYIYFNSIVISKLITGQLPISIFMGPIGIINLFYNNFNEFSGDLLYLIGMLNIALFYFNMLPIPCLDGSLILLATIERLVGRKKFSIRFQNLLLEIGTIAIIFLAIQIAIYDLAALLS